MKSHRFDPISFVFGATFVALSLILTSHHVALAAERMKWLGAAFLLALGVALLMTSGRKSRS
jgi:hypothetical protein